MKERNDYIIKSYYGIDSKQKNIPQLATELEFSEAYISQIIHTYNKSLSKEEKANLLEHVSTPIRTQRWDNSLKQVIFDSYFGLNGKDVSDWEEIIEEYDLKSMSRTSFYSIINTIKRKLVKEGVYSEAQLREITKRRSIILQNQKIKEYEYEYNSQCQ